MYKLFKFISILFVVSLLISSLSGCEHPPWEGASILVVKLDTPKDGETISKSPVTVSGRLSGPEASKANVSINGTSVTVQGGKFSTDVTLTEGKNVITVAATAGQAKLEEKANITYAPAKQ